MAGRLCSTFDPACIAAWVPTTARSQHWFCFLSADFQPCELRRISDGGGNRHHAAAESRTPAAVRTHALSTSAVPFVLSDRRRTDWRLCAGSPRLSLGIAVYPFKRRNVLRAA